jgi:antitoxin-like ribbon-helix-helix protein
MTKSAPDAAERQGIMRTLASFGRGRAVVAPPPERVAQHGRGYPVPPSRRTRKSFTTWQDEAALKQLKHLAMELGLSQQALIAEGINHVLAKYGKPTVAT